MHEIDAEVSTRKQKKEIGRQRRMPSHLKGGGRAICGKN